MNKLIFTLTLSLVAGAARAQIREFQTTRLNSTAGTGVASVLSTEAAVLNPASSVFFQDSSASYQTYKTSLNKKSDLRAAANDKFSSRNESQGFFISDSSGEVKGGMAYIQQAENSFRREKLVLHGAAPMGPNASVGMGYNYVLDKLPSGSSQRHQVQHQLFVGSTYVIDEDTILGLVIQDPTRTTPGEERVIGGFHYNLASRLSIMGDVGTQYTKSVSKEYLWRAALQVNVFSDLFIRAGKFYDNVREMKGTGWGVSWMGPNLGVEFAQKISDQFGDGAYLYQDEQLIDTSLSAIIKF